MSDRSTSAVQVNTTTTPSTDAGVAVRPTGTATELEFGQLMAGISWWATSTQQEQVSVWEMYREAGELDVDFVALTRDYASAFELLADGTDDDTDAMLQEQEHVAALQDAVEEKLASAQPAEPVPTSTIKQANDTLDKFGVLCKEQAECNYGMMQVAARFVDEFLGVAPGKSTRTTAVERLAQEWLRQDYEAEDLKPVRAKVNLLLRVNAVANLLGDGRGVAKGNGTKKGRGKGKTDGRIVWTKLRALSPLVERDADDYAERWHVQPHVADKAKALVTEIAASDMDPKDVVKAVEVLVLEEQAARIAEAKAQATADREAADAARAVELAALKQQAEAKRAADTAAAEAAKPDATPEVVDAAAKALEELRTKQAAAKLATEEKERAAQKAAQQLKEEQEQSRKQAEAEARKATKQAKREKGETVQAPPTPTANQGQNLLATAKQGTVRDVAEMALELVVGGEEPDSVLEALLDMLDGHKELSKASQRAVKAARASLSQSVSRTVTPAAAATALAAKDATQVNGQLVAAQ